MVPEDCPASGYVGDYLAMWAIWIAAVVAGETYLRHVYDQTEAFGLTLTTRAWFMRHVTRNSDGFRDRERTAAKPAGVERVACVGDSFTMRCGVADARDCRPQRIGRALDERSPGRIVVGYCLNDANDLLPPGRYFYANSVPRVPWLAPSTSFLADFAWFRLKQRCDPRVRDYGHGEEEAYDDPRIWAVQRAQFAHVADAYRGIPGPDLVVNRLDGHPNPAAHEIAARVVLERVFDVR